MKTRRLIAMLAVGAFLVTGAACSNDSNDVKAGGGDKTDKTDKTDQSDSADLENGDAGNQTPNTVDDAQFTKQLGELSTNITAAEGDVCQLMTVAQTSPPEPANAAQTKEFVDVWQQLLTAMADTVGGDNGQVMKDVAKQFSDAVAAKEYSPDVFEDEEIAAIMNSPEMQTAMTALTEKSASCFTGDSGGADDTADAGN